MPRRLKLSRLQAVAAEVEALAETMKPSFMCLYRPTFSHTLLSGVDEGHPDAQFELGRLYLEGRAAQSHNSYSGKDGKDVVASYTPAFERTYLAAEKWLQKAGDQGHPEAQQLLEVVKLHIKDGVH
jgi:TPR repeat protein